MKGRGNNYERGAALERKVKAFLEQRGWFCMRGAGSHGAVDIWATRAGVQLFVQAKTNGFLQEQEWNDLLAVARQYQAVPILARKGPRGTPVELLAINGPKIPNSRNQPLTHFPVDFRGYQPSDPPEKTAVIASNEA